MTEEPIYRIERLEERMEKHDEKLDKIFAKLNLILGGIIISPFIVALLGLLMKVRL